MSQIFVVTPGHARGLSFAPKALWCGWRDSNPHAVRHMLLRHACLPIPPQPHDYPTGWYHSGPKRWAPSIAQEDLSPATSWPRAGSNVWEWATPPIQRGESGTHINLIRQIYGDQMEIPLGGTDELTLSVPPGFPDRTGRGSTGPVRAVSARTVASASSASNVH